MVGLVNADAVASVTLSSTGAAASASVAGSPYPIVIGGALGTGLDNYDITYENAELTVDPKALTISATDQSKTYGSLFTFDTSDPSLHFDVVGLVNADAVASVTLSSTGAAASASVAGSPYPIVIGGALGTGLDNYDITYENAELTVDPKALTISATDQSKTYGSLFTFDTSDPSLHFDVVGLVNADAVASVTLSSTGAAASASVAGSPYPIVIGGALGTGLDNYDITYENAELTVDPKALTISATDQSKTYGSLFTFDTSDPSLHFDVVGLVNADAVASVTLSSTGAAASASVAGSPYPIVIGGALGTGLDNYDITYENAELTVDPKALTISATDQSKTYGSLFTFDTSDPSLHFDVVGLVNADAVASVTLSSTGAAASASVAGSPYPIVIGGALGTGLDNYDITYENAELTVDPKALTISATDQSKTYGSLFTFDTSDPSLHFDVVGLVNADAVASVTLSSTGAAASASVAGSPYPIVIGGALGTGLDNYDITYENAELTVDPKALTISATDQSKTYGSLFTFDTSDPSLHFDVVGLVNADAVASVTLSSTGAAASASVAGSPYPIVIGGALGTGLDNYDITYENAELTVDPKALTISATDQSKTYGSLFTFDTSDPSLHFDVVGLVNADAVASVTLSSTGAAASASVAGSPYPIVIGGALGTGLDNYDITYENAELTVDPKALTISATDQSKTYGSLFTFDTSDPSLHFDVVGLVNADAVASVTLSSTGAAASASVAGSPYPIVIGGALGTGLDNYDITYENAELTVDPKALTISATDQSKTYGSLFTFDTSDPSLHFDVVGLVNADAVASVTLSSTGAAASASVAGSPYPIVIGGALGTGLDNYDITYENAELTVDPKALTISATDQSKTYGSLFTFDTSDPSLPLRRGRPGQRRRGRQRDPQQHRRGGQRQRRRQPLPDRHRRGAGHRPRQLRHRVRQRRARGRPGRADCQG